MTEDDKNTGPAGLLELCGVCLSLDDAPLFSALDVAVPAGEVVTIMGPSGCGKSSLLAFICGTLPPVFEAAGETRLDGVALDGLPPEQRHVGILFQDDLLFPHMSVGENLSFGLPPGVSDRAARREFAAYWVLIRPMSAWIRRILLRGVREKALATA